MFDHQIPTLRPDVEGQVWDKGEQASHHSSRQSASLPLRLSSGGRNVPPDTIINIDASDGKCIYRYIYMRSNDALTAPLGTEGLLMEGVSKLVNKRCLDSCLLGGLVYRIGP
jgi:hypothetical protein